MRDPRASSQDDHIDVIRSEERLLVGTERVPIEQVRIVKRLVTETRTVEVTLRREELVVERSPAAAGGMAHAGELADDLVMTLSEEVPVITTEVRPLERVRVRVERVAGQQSVEAELRRERIEVQTDDGVRTGHDPVG